MLGDGDYDVLVVDATVLDDGAVSLDMTIVAGEAKGEVVTIRAQGLRGDPIDLLGVPGTLTVSDGSPTLRFEP